MCDVNTSHLLQGLLGIVALLEVPQYREAVLEGVVASIGGLDASLSKEASAALLTTLNALPPPGAAPNPCMSTSVTTPVLLCRLVMDRQA